MEGVDVDDVIASRSEEEDNVAEVEGNTEAVEPSEPRCLELNNTNNFTTRASPDYEEEVDAILASRSDEEEEEGEVGAEVTDPSGKFIAETEDRDVAPTESEGDKPPTEGE